MKETKALIFGSDTFEIMDEKARPVTNVEAMKSMTNLVAGNVIKTAGFHNAGDGGSALYLIKTRTNEHVEDNGSIHYVGDGLVAELIVNNIVNVKQFGAYGDRIHDDTQAFKNANKYITNKVKNIEITGQSINVLNMILEIPYGQYLVKGNKILGSIIESDITDYKSFGYQIEGNNSSIFWDVQNETDSLFYFDYTITNPTIKDLEILTMNTNTSNVTLWGSVFKIKSVFVAGKYQGLSNNGLYEKIRVVPFRNPNGGHNKPFAIFNIEGDTMCDQSLVLKCSFIEFKNLFYSTNSQAVNWIFNSSNGFTSEKEAVFFNVSRCNDNFVVENCSFSIYSSQYLLKAISPLGENNKILERGDYNFQFINNRIEVIGYVGDSVNWYPCYMNYGTFVMKNTNLSLATGGSISPIFHLKSNGSAYLENCTLGKPIFIIPSVDDEISGLGNFNKYALIVKNCFHNTYTLKTNLNGEIKEYLDCFTSNHPLRHAKFDNFMQMGTYIQQTFDLIGNKTDIFSDIKTLVYSESTGVAFGKQIKLPPHQTIRNIRFHILGTEMPGNYSTVRVYFGNEENNKYVDTTITPSNIKSGEVIYSGLASIIDNNVNNQYITVYFMVDGVKTAGVLSLVEIDYIPLSPYVQFYKSNSNVETIIK